MTEQIYKKGDGKMIHTVCFSGGHSSALTAIETVKKYGKENTILLNHDISPEVEDEDIKRFKQDISNYLDMPITYANMDGWETKTPLKVCVEIAAFKVDNGTALCTNRLKTEPFKKWLKENFPADINNIRDDMRVIYGFDMQEQERIQRRVGVMASMGYRTEYPLATWERTIEKTEDIGIQRPSTYKLFRHANCKGCLKAGRQQWYLVYCLYPELFEQAKEAEDSIGYSIIKGIYLEEIEPKFKKMMCQGIIPSEKLKPQQFWAIVKRIIRESQDSMPCECAL
jgi:hypothetical protein